MALRHMNAHINPIASPTQQAIDDIARRHGFSVGATLAMHDAIVAGNGTMAQFNHPEFAGPGQWMHGGMTMISDMFDHRLKGRVDSLCRELADLVDRKPVTARSGGLPSQRQDDGRLLADLGRPDSSGSQNGMRYAYFADARRLVIEADGKGTVYDTLDHRIGGCSQQQSSRGTLSFTSQHGRIDLGSLPVISVDGDRPGAEPPDGLRERTMHLDRDSLDDAPAQGAGELLATLERLADLHARNILSDDEFTRKKTELLSRL